MEDEDLPSDNFKAPAMPPLSAKAFLKPKEKRRSQEIKSPAAENAEQPINKTEEVNVVKNVPEAPPLDYTPPPWACDPEPELGYKIEILKNGTIVEVQDLEQRNNGNFLVIGRLPICDITMEHPSVSRYHCILQYGDDKMDKKGKGWFIYDMGSTHGTKMNKNRLPPKQYIRVQVGFVFQFGNSTRICSFIGPAEDAEPEWDCSPTEMRDKMMKKALEKKLAAAARKEIQEEKEREEEDGISWGMDYGEEMGGISLFDADGNLDDDGEAYYYEDPKKALSKFFERVGFDMNFTYAESGLGHTHKWTCSIELPVEIDGTDRTCTAQAIVSTNKKDATIQCALEACKLLDRHGVLRGGSSRVRMKKKNLEENDFFDEDDDLFFDRTGQLETQRDKRKQWTLKAMGKGTDEKDTYETLQVKLKATQEQMAEVQKDLDKLGHNKLEGQAGDVDEYVNKLAKGNITVKDDMQTKILKSTLRQKLVSLTHEAQTLEKLVKITKPASLPDLAAPQASSENASKQSFLRKMMKFGNVKKQLASVEAKVAAESVVLEERAKEPAMPPEKDIQQPKEEENVSEKIVEKKKRPSTDKKIEEPSTSFEHTIPENIREEFVRTSPEPPVDEPVNRLPIPVRFVDDPNLLANQPKPQNERKRSAEPEDEPQTSEAKRKRKPRIRKEKWAEYGAGCENKDEQYATWMPPENQEGDGKTSLNNKFAGRY